MTLALSSDELRIAIAVHGGNPPAALDGGWSADDRPVADTAALRSLLARDLAAASETGVALSDDMSTVAAAFTDTPALTELRRDGAACPGRWLITQHTVTCVESRPELWRVLRNRDVTTDLIASCIDHLPNETPPSAQVSLPTDLLVEAERRSTTCTTEQVAGTLAAHGLRHESANLVARLLADVHTTVTLRTAHRDGMTVHGSAVTWLETESMGVWLAVPTGDEQSLNQPDVAANTELRSATRAAVVTEVHDVLGLARMANGR
jgi:hypothetical protein